MKAVVQNPPLIEVDSFIIKSSGNRIDTVIDRTLAVGTDADKYAFTYNGSGDITQMDHIRTSGIFFVYEDIYKYTLSGSPAALALGNEAIFWYFFAHLVNVSYNTDFSCCPLYCFTPPNNLQSWCCRYQAFIPVHIIIKPNTTPSADPK
jgi:hypothetical protein